MQFSEFQSSIKVEYKHRPDDLTYAILGIGGEAGEVVEVYKKAMRLGHPQLIKISKSGVREALLDELGDVLWYIARVADLLGVDLETVAQMNMKKLAYRRIHGKEDDAKKGQV